MIGLDTNILVRYLTQDDPKQSPKASRLIESLSEENPGYIAQVALVELVWVLISCYDLSRDECAQALEMLLRTKDLKVAEPDLAWGALRSYRSSNADFADCLIERAGAKAGCTHTMTFDIAAAKSAGMVLA